MAQKKRYRIWASIAYPESMISYEEWSELILGIRYILSPLHDKDTNKDGTNKKAHYHVMFLFDAPKTYEQIKEITDKFKIARPEPVADTAAYARYLIHADEKDKYHYNKEDIITHGIDYNDMIQTKEDNEKEEMNFIKQIFEVIDKFQIKDISDLFNYVVTEQPENYRYLRQNAYLLTNVLKARQQQRMIPIEN